MSFKTITSEVVSFDTYFVRQHHKKELLAIIRYEFVSNTENSVMYNIILTWQTCTNSDWTSCFLHNNIHYIQTEGLAVGTPTYEIFSEVFVQHLEPNITMGV